MRRPFVISSFALALALAPAVAGAACAAGTLLLFASPQQLLNLAAKIAG